MSRLYPILIMIVLEVFVQSYASVITEDIDVLYSLRSRYSARISFAILSILGLWIASLGLHTIFANEEKRNILIGGITAFSINHLIHYFYLYNNFEVNDLDIQSKYVSFGALAYIVLALAPLVIWRWNTLTRGRYYLIYGFIILMISICIFTYSSRFGSSLPMSPPMWVFRILIGIGVITIAIMVGRMIKERSHSFDN